MINTVNFLNFKSNLQAIRQNNVNRNQIFAFKNSKLMPLAKDTISFSGVLEYKAALNNKDICEELHENAKPANEYLKTTLTKYFNDIVYSKDNPDGTIEPIKARVKTVDSIEEKVSDKISDALHSREKIKEIFSPYDVVGIKDKIRDISGARIVVKDAFGDSMDSVVDKLCNMIREERLIVDEVENHTSKVQGVEPYFNEQQLERILETINDVRVNIHGLEKIKIIDKPSKNGYMALHLSIDTTQNPIAKYRNFYSELQIIGSDVELLKDVEDLCYKLKKGMAIRSNDVSYRAFEELFLKAYNDEENYPDIKEAFKEYTIKAYQIQRNRHRSKDIKDDTTNWAYRYPTIKECGLEGKIPPILDFNMLARIKRDCDDLYYVRNHGRTLLDDINQLPVITNKS